ncbi:phage tail protein [Streptomyces sp. NPDC054834]
MPAPKALALRPTVSTAAAGTAATHRPEAPSRTGAQPQSSNAAVTALLAAGRVPAASPPVPGRPASAAQDMFGNGAVAAAGQAQSGPAGPAATAPAAPAPAPAAAGDAQAARARPGPDADPKFARLKKDVGHKKRALAASHPPPRTEATAAQNAARPPKDDAEAQGKTANAEKMNEARPKEFDKEAFIRAVEKAIADKAPKNLDEADKFADSGKADEVRAEVHGKVGEGKSESAQQIATTTAAPPDIAAAVPKQVVPMTADRPPAPPGAPDAASAVPDRLPPSATDLSAGPADVNQRMADAQVTEAQLQRSNEPTFNQALGEKKAAERHSEMAPGRMRGHEKQVLNSATAQARRLGTAAMGAMGVQRALTGQRVDTGKSGAKGRDEEKRAQVTTLLQGVFDTMQKDVQGILGGLDKLVDDQFGRGEKQARDAFTAEHKQKMEEYKDRRYSGATGKLRWVRDLFAGLPAEADKIFEEARDHYVRRMRQVVSDVATTIGAELNRAKRRIAQGRSEMRAAVDRLPADLRTIGREAAAEFSDRFDQLTQSVDDKGTQLVDTLATKYTDALKSVDDEIAAEKEKNKGLVAKAVDAVKAVIDTIMELKNLLLAVLAKAAQAVMLILKDPIGFLRNLVTAVGAGLRQFLRNIGRHLQQGIMSWLLGKASEAGLELPAKFDAQGVVQMLASLLGLTWKSIRARIVRKVPKMEPAIAAAETALPLVAEVRKRGVAGMWEDLKARVGDLKKELLDKVIAYVTPTVVEAGIMWVLSLLNPASAFVRAVKLIIDVVRFVVTQARQIFEFVNAVLDAVIAIARGGSGGVPSLIERALARSVPVLLGFLASLLGLGGIAAKVRQIVQALSKPVNRAVDWVIDKIVGLVKKLWAKIKSKFDTTGRKKQHKARKPGGEKPGHRPAATHKPQTVRDGKKNLDGKDAEVPKRLAEPAELTISRVSRELAKEIQEARDGQVVHRTDGNPKQITKALLARHSDAKYDKASGTLILPKLSGSITGSLSALGSQIAAKTGVSKVSLEKQDKNVEIWGGINPRTRLAKITGLPTDEAILRIAVTQVGIVQFLKNMASGSSMTVTQGTVTGTIGMTELEAAWTEQANIDYLKNKFRDAMKGHHEWLPSDYILEVTRRAARDLVTGPRWIDLQHELRSATFRVVYNPSLAAPVIVRDKVASDPAERPYSVPHGHVGAVYFPGRSGSEKTNGSSTFHNELRTAFTGATTVKGSAQAAHAVAKRWVWDGSPISPDIHPKCVDKNSKQVTAAGQAVNVADVEALFQRFI